MSEVGKRCTDGYRYGTVVEEVGCYVKVKWDYGSDDVRWRDRGMIRILDPSWKEG